MTRHGALAVLLLLLLLGVTETRGADEVSNSERYWSVFFSVLGNLNSALKSKGVPVLDLDLRRVRIGKAWDPWCPNVVEVDLNPKFNVQFFPRADNFNFRIASMYRDIPLGWLGSYDAPPKPTWNSDRAIQEARFWFEVVYGEPLAHVGAAETEYADQMNLPKFRNGLWRIRWPRIDSDGHRFRIDNVSCSLDEKYGLRYLSEYFVSTFAEGQKMLISAEQAIAIARPAAEKLLTAPMTSFWPRGLTLKSEAKAEVLILNPNHILKYKTPDEMPLAGDVVARLAWVTKFCASDGKGTDRYIYLWIDTETKEVLGGDFNEK